MDQTTILIVDDEPNLLSGITRNLHDQFEFETAATGLEALERLRYNPKIGVVMTDLRMPNMNGIELLIEIQRLHPQTVRLMLSGNADLNDMAQAVNEGHIFRFLTKPCQPELLARMLNSALEQRRLIESEKILLQKTLNGSVQVLVDILSMFDSEAFGQAQTLRILAKYMAEQFDEDPWIVENAALLSHLSMVTIPTDLIQRYRSGDELTVPERDIFQKIPKSSAALISQIPRLDVVAETILYQRKHFNGVGFPNDKVSGLAIPIGARILKGSRDFLDLIQSGLKVQEALEKMQGRPGEYDPAILQMMDICKEAIEKQVVRRGMTTLKLSDMAKLRPGQLVKQKIETKAGILIVREGIVLQAALIEKITNFAHLNILKLPIVIEEVEVVE
jgi:response regulator RpfG family c-di-GMP phosphodiesterase